MSKIYYSIGLLVFILFWTLFARLQPMLVPGPAAVYQAGLTEFNSGILLELFSSSLKHYLIGLFFGLFFSILLGSLSGVFPKFSSFIYGFITMLRPIPAIAWIPFVIVCFGISQKAAATLIAIGVFWICFFALDTAFRNTNPDYLELASAYGYKSKSQQFLKIYFPANLPVIVSAIRTSAGQAWTFVIAAELFGVSGIGQRMWEAAGLVANDIVIFYLIMICILYVSIDLTLLKLEKRVAIWK